VFQEDIPATLSVATASYNVLVLLLLAFCGAAYLPKVLAARRRDGKLTCWRLCPAWRASAGRSRYASSSA
jgi:hypothetical protein